MYDLIVAGNAFIEGGIRKCEIGICEGRIDAIRGHIDRIGTRPTKVVLSRGILVPGAVDAHVHFRDPGHTQKADIRTESEAAVRGGVCTVLDMPNTNPPTIDPGYTRSKIEQFSRRSWVDFGVFYGLTPMALASEADAAKALEMSVGSKLYMASTTGDLLVDDPKMQRRLIELHRRLAPEKVLCAHAEDQPIIASKAGLPLNSTKDHDAQRPVESELKAVQAFISMTEGVKAHVAHVTAGSVAVAVRGPGVTCEAAPHHLFLSFDDIQDARGKVNPPLRSRDERDALWKALAAGHIDMVASDHAPHTMAEKEKKFSDAPSGVPGVGTTAPLLFATAVKHRITMAQFIKLTSSGPAHVYGLSSKGAIRKGMDADIVGYDPSDELPITGADLAYKCGWTPFEGMPAVMPRVVVAGGREAVRDSQLHGVPDGARNVATQIRRE